MECLEFAFSFARTLFRFQILCCDLLLSFFVRFLSFGVVNKNSVGHLHLGAADAFVVIVHVFRFLASR